MSNTDDILFVGSRNKARRGGQRTCLTSTKKQVLSQVSICSLNDPGGPIQCMVTQRRVQPIIILIFIPHSIQPHSIQVPGSMSQKETPSPLVLIAGAGLGGLTAAIMCEKANINYMVLERAVNVRLLGKQLFPGGIFSSASMIPAKISNTAL